MTDVAVKLASKLLSAEINPLGAELSRLRDREGHDLLWNGDPAFWTGRAPLLFPIVGRLPGDVLVHGGQSYPMAQHGFARRRAFRVLEASAHQASFSLDADEETRRQYPFPFALHVTYALNEATLTITARLSNPGAEPLPASFGFHPAFRWPLPYGGSRNDHRLVFEKAEVEPLPLLKEGLLSGESVANPAVDAVVKLDDELFMRDALVFTRLRSRHIRYGVPGEPGLEVAFPDMPHLGLWSKPGAPFLCIEPWQGHASPEGASAEFLDKPGLVLVAPGEERSFSMSVRWLPNSGDDIGG